MLGKVYKNIIGLIIQIDMQEDITDAVVPITLSVRKGEGTLVEWSIYSIHENQYLRYVTIEGDIDEIGTYYIQPNIVTGDWSGKCKTVSFHVYNTWE